MLCPRVQGLGEIPVTAGRYLPCLQVSALPVVSHNMEGFSSGTPSESVTFQQHFFFTAVFQEPGKAHFVVDYVLDLQGKMSALM